MDTPPTASQILADFNRATDPRTPLTVLEQLAQGGHPDVLVAVVRHPSVSLELLRAIQRKTDDPEVHLALVESPLADRSLLGSYEGEALLLHDRCREALFANPATPAGVRRSYRWLRVRRLLTGE